MSTDKRPALERGMRGVLRFKIKHVAANPSTAEHWKAFLVLPFDYGFYVNSADSEGSIKAHCEAIAEKDGQTAEFVEDGSLYHGDKINDLLIKDTKKEAKEHIEWWKSCNRWKEHQDECDKMRVVKIIITIEEAERE